MTRCARRMGYQDIKKDDVIYPALEAFSHDFETHSQAVNQLFSSLFKSEEPVGLQEVVLNSQMDSRKAIAKIEKEGIDQAEEFYEGIALLRQTPSFPYSPRRTRNLLANLVPLLTKHTALMKHPRHLFANLDRFAESLGSRTNLYSEMIENKNFRNRLLQILSSSEFLSEILIRNPELLDSISNLPSPKISYTELKKTIELAMSTDKSSIHGLYLFKRREEFKVGLQDIFHHSPLQSRLWLSELADLSVQWTASSLCDNNPKLSTQDFSILALGKLGGKELTYHSDLDLILIFDQKKISATEKYLSKLLQEIQTNLELHTELGRCYKLDLRLRPEGKYGALAIPYQRLEQYFKTRIEPWERLAYVKSRVLEGFSQNIDLTSLIWEKPFSVEEIKTLNHIRMRQETEIGKEKNSNHYNFKVGRGGLADIQFIVQYLQIQNKIKGANTLYACSRLVDKGYLNKTAGTILSQWQKFLFSLETTQRLLQENSSNKISKNPSDNAMLADFLNIKSGETLLEQYLSTREQIRTIYRQFFQFDN